MTEKKIDDKERTITSTDRNGNPVTVIVRQPTPKEYRDSQVAYNKSFREALDSGALLRHKLTDYMKEQGLWDDAKQEQNDKYIQDLSDREDQLKAGGIPLVSAKKVALEMRSLREEFRLLLAERNMLDGNSAEGQADNARFNALVCLCIIDPRRQEPYFFDQDAYDSQADQPWVIEAASELANMLYGLDPNYDNTLEEHKFLKEFKFMNEKHEFINGDGHLIDTDIDGVERLIDKDGRFVAYHDDGEQYYVNRDGEEVVLVKDKDDKEEWVKASLADRKPFLDEAGEPIIAEIEPETEEKEVKAETEETGTEPASAAKPKKKRRTSKVDTKGG